MDTADVAYERIVKEYPQVVVSEEQILKRTAVGLVKVELDLVAHRKKCIVVYTVIGDRHCTRISTRIGAIRESEARVAEKPSAVNERAGSCPTELAVITAILYITVKSPRSVSVFRVVTDRPVPRSGIKRPEVVCKDSLNSRSVIRSAVVNNPVIQCIRAGTGYERSNRFRIEKSVEIRDRRLCSRNAEQRISVSVAQELERRTFHRGFTDKLGVAENVKTVYTEFGNDLPFVINRCPDEISVFIDSRDKSERQTVEISVCRIELVRSVHGSVKTNPLIVMPAGKCVRVTERILRTRVALAAVVVFGEVNAGEIRVHIDQLTVCFSLCRVRSSVLVMVFVPLAVRSVYIPHIDRVAESRGGRIVNEADDC